MGKKSLSVNAGETRIICAWCKVSMVETEDSMEHSCDVCRKVVGDNSSHAWIVLYIDGQGVNRRCSGIAGNWRVMLISIAGGAWQVRMVSLSQFCCKKLWLSPMWSWNVSPSSAYLGDTLDAGGGAEEAARARASAKFKDISFNLIARSESYRIEGKILKACIQSVLT